MGIFTRVRDIIASNFNSMLDKAEDPEKLVKLMIQEMEDTLVEVKASTAGAIAAKKKVSRAFSDAKDRSDQWGKKAELAIQKGREDLAREALLEKRSYRDRVDALGREAEQCESIVEQYQSEIRQLEERLTTAREKQRVLVQRHVQAKKKKKAETEIRRADSSDTFTRFQQFENRIERMEADADLVNYGRKRTLDESFADLETDEEIEEELRALKVSVGKESADKEGEQKPSA